MSRNVKKLLIVGLVILLIPVIIVLYFSLPWVMIFLGNALAPNPPKPEITYGEFPFELVYEIDGETVTVNDVYVCEFDGFGMNEGQGKYREWKGYVQGTGEEGVILFEEGEVIIWCYIGSPKYYMGEVKYIDAYTPNVVKESPYLSGTSYEGLRADELWELYNIRIISWQFSDPIENSFRYFWQRKTAVSPAPYIMEHTSLTE